MRRKETIRIVLCGHLDHGKSTLSGRLLLETKSIARDASAGIGNPAFLTDQFKDERDEARTIDATQVFLKNRRRRYCLIDTPGHLEFIKNMITGVTQADAAVLLVDAQEGARSETQRHAILLEMLGISAVIVVINKMDLVGYSKERFAELRQEIVSFFKKLRLKPLFVIPLSAKNGDNILKKHKAYGWYKGPTLLKAMDALAFKTDASKKPLRFAVQDIYHEKGKEIVAGRVESGCMRVRQRIVCLPAGAKAAILSLRAFEKRKSVAYAQESIGVILKDLHAVKRGDVLCLEKDAPLPVRHLKATVLWMSDHPLVSGKKMIFRCATQEAGCVARNIVERIDSSTLAVLEKDAGAVMKNEMAGIILETDRLVVVENFNHIEELGRFVLDLNDEVVAVGIVTESRLTEGFLPRTGTL